jgi:chaperonin cofactor prefoldin
VTRTDLEKLRGEIVGSFVDRASYEARHQALVDRNSQLEISVKELRKDTESDLQKIHERLESGKQQIEDRLKAQQEKPWTRIGQLAGYAGLAAAVAEWLFQHLKF